jgi:hypothetical protein
MLNEIRHTSNKAPDGTDFNDPPIGLRRISEKEFATSQFFTYTPKATEYRQVYVVSASDLTAKRNGNKMITLHMFWFDDDTGIAMHNDYWQGKVEYFAFGCKHEYREMEQGECRERGISHFGHCYHVCECNKCKHIWSYDSSD